MNNINKKITQMLLVGIPNKESIDNVINLIRNYAIGGVLLYKNNYDNLDELKELIIKLKEANKNNDIPLFIAIDQEGGRVNRLPLEFNNLKNAFFLEKKDDDIIELSADTVSSNLYKLGINMNLNLVLDLKKFDDNHAIGNRAYSDNPNRICKIYDIISSKYINNNVIPVIKHFPGQGSIKTDSHVFLPYINNYDKDIIPFKYAIDNKCDIILVGHMLIKNKTGIYPASISKKFINNTIRGELNYDGIVMTDEINMKSIRLFYGRKNSLKLAYLAGNDIICFKYISNKTEKYINYINKLVLEKKFNPDNSYNRILKCKSKYEIKDTYHFDKIDIDKYNEIIDKINNS